MSTWTSERSRRGAWRASACAALLLALPGCLAPVPQGPQPAVTQTVLASGAVRVTAPRGYCIDDGSVRRLAGGGGFALLAPCTQLSGPGGPVAAPALMTVSVMRASGEAAPPDVEGLVAAIAPTPVGARGEAAGLAYAQVMEGGEAVLPGGDPRHWRGTRAVGGYLASLALYAPQGSSLAGREGRLLLGDFAAGLAARAKNTAEVSSNNANTQTRAENNTSKTPRPGLLARLFPNS